MPPLTIDTPEIKGTIAEALACVTTYILAKFLQAGEGGGGGGGWLIVEYRISICQVIGEPHIESCGPHGKCSEIL